MKINNNREMHVLEMARNRINAQANEFNEAYEEAVKGFALCPIRPMGPCPVECGQCQGTGWVKRK